MQLLIFLFFIKRAAFFRGQIEERRTSRMSSWFSPGDLEILIAISCVGVYLIEPHEGVRTTSADKWLFSPLTLILSFL